MKMGGNLSGVIEMLGPVLAWGKSGMGGEKEMATVGGSVIVVGLSGRIGTGLCRMSPWRLRSRDSGDKGAKT